VANVNNASSPIEATFVARLRADEKSARRVADVLSESLDPAETACAAFEQPDGRWQVDVHFRSKPEATQLRAMIAQACGERLASGVTVQKIDARDWVKESLAGLKPVTAGRFIVHGAHDRARVPAHSIGIEIEAGTAFGMSCRAIGAASFCSGRSRMFAIARSNGARVISSRECRSPARTAVTSEPTPLRCALARVLTMARGSMSVASTGTRNNFAAAIASTPEPVPRSRM
jgi:ribosomal protein L11 methyltransferase